MWNNFYSKYLVHINIQMSIGKGVEDAVRCENDAAGLGRTRSTGNAIH